MLYIELERLTHSFAPFPARKAVHLPAAFLFILNNNVFLLYESPNQIYEEPCTGEGQVQKTALPFLLNPNNLTLT